MVDISSEMQRRIHFPPTAQELSADAYIVGRLVALSCQGDRLAELHSHLSSLNSGARLHEVHGSTVPANRLHLLFNLPDSVRVTPDLELDPIWELAMRQGAGLLDTPATLTMRRGNVHLRWEGADGDVIEGRLSDDALAVLVHSGLPFSAAQDAWKKAAKATSLPVAAGHAELDRAGYVRIKAHHPHQVEASPIPGLWKVDSHSYGTPLPYLPHSRKVEGIVWPKPKLSRPHETVWVTELLDVDSHIEAGAAELSRRLDRYGSSVIAWPQGSGRRMVILRALQQVEALPTQVLCPAWQAWVWRDVTRELRLPVGSVEIVTRQELQEAPLSKVFPSVVIEGFETLPHDLPALEGLSSVDGLIRVGLPDSWPKGAAERCAAMRVIRPEEFTGPAETILLRYPLWPERRGGEHADAYLLPNPAISGSRKPRRRTSVKVMSATKEQRIAGSELSSRADLTKAEKIRRLRTIATAGLPDQISPKIAAVSDLLRQRTGPYLVLCDDSKAARLVQTIARGRPVQVMTWGEANHNDAFGRYMAIVAIDYADEAGQLAKAVESVPDGAYFALVHLEGSIDDQLAMREASGREIEIA